jgi:very-short-patch-repair endonuclease
MREAKPQRADRSRRLRRDATDAERRLWYRLRSRQIEGAKFVRQDSIGPYVVDFVCRELRLIVEVDGGQHATDTRDAVRDGWLADRGYRVLRFWNNDVLLNTEGVLETIAAAASAAVTLQTDSAGAQTRGDAPSPRPSPRTRGEGAQAPCPPNSR